MSAPRLELVRGRALLGLKGPRAQAWLAALGVAVPQVPNTWRAGANSVSIVRLGAAEFFLDTDAADATLATLRAQLRAGPPGVYPVPREDWELRLAGARADEMLAEIAAVDFAALDTDARPIIMTLMAGIAVVVAPYETAGERTYRIWCDPTFGPALNEILGTLVRAYDGCAAP